MKITKEQGRACLHELEFSIVNDIASEALREMTGGFAFWSGDQGEVDTALAMCAAIAGVKPEDVE